MRLAAAAVLLLAAAGCAHGPATPRNTGLELFAVVPGHGGHVGTIVVQVDGCEQVLDKAYAASRVGAGGRANPAPCFK